MSTVPDQVLNLAVQPSKSSNGRISLTVTWDKPHSDVDIARYEVSYRIQSTGRWSGGFSRAPTNRQHVYMNLMSGVNYEVRVRAWSWIGFGEYRIVTPTGTGIVGNYTESNYCMRPQDRVLYLIINP